MQLVYSESVNDSCRAGVHQLCCTIIIHNSNPWSAEVNQQYASIPIASMVLLYMVCHGSHQYTPFMLALIYQHHGSVMGYASINGQPGWTTRSQRGGSARHGGRCIGTVACHATDDGDDGGDVLHGKTAPLKFYDVFHRNPNSYQLVQVFFCSEGMDNYNVFFLR